MAIIATKGTLDWAYPPFILASTAAALGWEASIFFTFYGLLLLKKEIPSEVSPLGNPAMPMKMPFGPQWFQDFAWPMPNLIMAGIPGFEKVATGLMKKTFKNKGVATVEELRELCIEAEVKMYACQIRSTCSGSSTKSLSAASIMSARPISCDRQGRGRLPVHLSNSRRARPVYPAYTAFSLPACGVRPASAYGE